MNVYKPNFISETAKEIALDPQIAKSSVGDIATRWSQLMQGSEKLEPSEAYATQAVVTKAAYDEVTPKLPAEAGNEDGVTGLAIRPISPHEVLLGDYDKETQIAFLNGALMALERAIESRIANIEQ